MAMLSHSLTVALSFCTKNNPAVHGSYSSRKTNSSLFLRITKMCFRTASITPPHFCVGEEERSKQEVTGQRRQVRAMPKGAPHRLLISTVLLSSPSYSLLNDFIIVKMLWPGQKWISKGRHFGSDNLGHFNVIYPLTG